VAYSSAELKGAGNTESKDIYYNYVLIFVSKFLDPGFIKRYFYELWRHETSN